MNETVQDLADLNQLTGEDAAAAPTQAPAPKYEAVRDEFGRSYATGRRKEEAHRRRGRAGRSGRRVREGHAGGRRLQEAEGGGEAVAAALRAWARTEHLQGLRGVQRL